MKFSISTCTYYDPTFAEIGARENLLFSIICQLLIKDVFAPKITVSPMGRQLSNWTLTHLDLFIQVPVHCTVYILVHDK